VGYHDVIPTWQSFILGDIEKELYETRKQRSAKVIDVLSSPAPILFSGPNQTLRNCGGWAMQNRIKPREVATRRSFAVGCIAATASSRQLQSPNLINATR
jgi:hypothetical protein